MTNEKDWVQRYQEAQLRLDERAIHAKTIMIWIAGGCSVASLAFGIYSSLHNYPIVISVTAIGAPALILPKMFTWKTIDGKKK